MPSSDIVAAAVTSPGEDLVRIGATAAVGRVESLLRAAVERRPSGTLLPAKVTAEILDHYGIPHAHSIGVRSRDHAVEMAEELRWPVMMSSTRWSPDRGDVSRSHRGPLSSPEEVISAWDDLVRIHGPRGVVEAVMARALPVSVGAVEFSGSWRREPDGSLGVDVDTVVEVSTPGADSPITAAMIGLMRAHPMIDVIEVHRGLVDSGAWWILETSIHAVPLKPQGMAADS